MTNATAAYAFTQLNKLFKLLYAEEFKNMFGSLGYVKRNGKKLKDKVVLMPNWYVSPKLTKEEIESIYPYPIGFAAEAKIENAILEQDPYYAVAYYVPIPAGSKIVHRIYITNSEDGDVYGVLDGNKFTVNLGPARIGNNKEFLFNMKELKQLAGIVD